MLAEIRNSKNTKKTSQKKKNNTESQKIAKKQTLKNYRIKPVGPNIQLTN